ncbi:MAG: glycosyltransferase family 4 protein [Acidobacteriota bacterium]
MTSPHVSHLRVAALTGGWNEPSARFRVRQHIAPLAEQGIQVRELVPAIARHAHFPGWPASVRLAWAPPLWAAWQAAKLAARLPGIAASYRHDLTWLERGLLPGWPSLEPLLRRPLVLDVDDAIWLQPPFGRAAAQMLARRAAVVIAGNAHIAEWFGAHARDVRVVPTAVDSRMLISRPGGTAGTGRFVVGWIGTSWNFPYLTMIETALGRFLAVHDAELLIVADRPPALAALPAGKLRFRQWSLEEETAFFAAVDVGLMPLADDDWARGKCALKMLQYMACGIPAVVSPVGVAQEILSQGEVGFGPARDGEWSEVLETLQRDQALRRRLGAAGRLLVERSYSVDVVAAQLAAIFHALA